LAVEHFLKCGRSRIAILAGPAYSISAQRRLDGYRATLAEAGLLFDPFRLEHCEPTYDGGRAAMAAILERRPRIEAVFAFNDLVAVGAMQEIEAQGKCVPGDIAVIGTDDIPLAKIARPRLTTLRVNLVDLGRLAMETLLKLIAGVEPVEPLIMQITPELIIRESA
jgi:DNA-binding LacI/PurR family transcriptional regulator